MNKTTSSYFNNLFIRRKKLLMLYSFIGFVAFPMILIIAMISHHGDLLYGAYTISQVMFSMACIVLGILALVLPIFTFKFSLTKKNVDTYYSLPINRNHLFKTHFFGPIVGVIMPLLVNYLIGAVLMIVLYSVQFQVILNLLFLLIIAFVFFMIIYSINTFLVLNCNNVLDACVISGSFIFISILVYVSLRVFLDSQIVNTGMVDIPFGLPEVIFNLLNPYNMFVNITSILTVSYVDGVYKLFLDCSNVNVFYYVYYLVIGILAYLGSKSYFKKKKGEDAEQLTTSFITYPLFTNIGMVSIFLFFNLAYENLTSSILIILFIFVIYVVVNGIAKRSIKIQKSTIFSFVVLLVLVNGFNYISKETEFFGINRQVIDYQDYSRIEWHLDLYNDDKESIVKIIEVEDMNENDIRMMEYLKELQKEASLNHKEDKYDSSDAHLTINYMTQKHPASEDRYVWFDLNEQQIQYIRKWME